MTKYSALILGPFLVLSGLPMFAAPQVNRGNDRVCVYQNNNYTGQEQCYNADAEISNVRNAEISSIRLYGRVGVTVYEKANFQGNSREFSTDVPDLAALSMSGSKTWNDRVGSLRVTSDAGRDNRSRNGRSNSNDRYERNNGRYGGNRTDGNYGSSAYPPVNVQRTQEGVCVYENANYQGRSQCWSAGNDMPELGSWRDRISSIRVFGGARVVLYRDAQFQGAREVIDRDIPNLAQLSMQQGSSWNDQTSSLQIQAGNFGRSRRF